MLDADASRFHRPLLAVIALLAVGPIAYYAINQRIDYDGWWHVFIASEVPWASFWRDVAANPHPPTYFLLLRGLMRFGSTRLVYRAPAIIAAVVAIYVMGTIGTRVFRARAVALLCAFAFGSAMTTVIMACAVRSYMLSTALLLIAFRYYLDLIDPTRERDAPRSRLLYTAALIAAIATHYSALFFFCASLLLPCVYAATNRQYGAWWAARLRWRWQGDVAAIVVVGAVAAAAYVAHMSRFAAPMVHTSQFYPSQSDSAAGFLAGAAGFFGRSIVAEIDLFSPLPIAPFPAAARIVIVSAMAIATAALALTLRRRVDWIVASAPLATLAIIAAAMFGASLFSRYPFGGFLRHQFILFPFIMLSGFALVDELVALTQQDRLLPVPAAPAATARRPPFGLAVLDMRRVVLTGVCAGLVVIAIVRWKFVRFEPVESSTQEITRFHRYFPDSHAVYVDKFSLIPFFAIHQQDTWLAQSQFGEKFFTLPLLASQHRLLVLRDMTRWNCDLSDHRLYADLRQAIADGHFPSVDLFRLKQDADRLAPPSGLEKAQLTGAVVEGAASAGLQVERLVLDGHHVYARLRLGNEPASATPVVIDLAGR